MKQIKRLAAMVLVSALFSWNGFAQKQIFPSKLKDGQTKQVDTRIDNMGYWNKMAEEGLVPFAQPVPVPPAKYTGSMIKSSSVKGMMEDSPDVPVTEATNVTESENSIFVSPTDNEFILNSNNSSSWSGGYAGSFYGANAFYSEDAGETWGGSASGAGGFNYGDPTTAINLDGTRMYVNYISSNYGMGISYSTDDGATWTAVSVSPNPGFLADKNHMWIDNGPTSPYEGNLYVAWTDFGGVNDNEVVIKSSSNEGLNWGSIINLSSAINAGSHNQGVNLQTGPDGQVYAIWAVYDSWPQDEKAIGFAKSDDGGATFTSAERIINNIRGIRNTGVGKSMRVNSFPAMAVDISSGSYSGNIYVVWSNIGEPGVNTGSDADVYLIRSEDEGETWSDPIKVNQDDSGLGNKHYQPWITCDPETGILSAIWYDDRDVSSTQCEVYCGNSFDGGETWEDFKVSDVSFTPASIPGMADGYMGDYLGITARGSMVYPVWTDTRDNLFMTYTSPYVTNNLPKPTSLLLELDEESGAVSMSWEFDGWEDFLYFNVYHEGEVIGTTTDMTYAHNLPDYGIYSYGVSAVHNEGESVIVSGSVQWGDAHISVTPGEINENLEIGNSVTKTLVVENTGELELNYDLVTEITSKKGVLDYCDASGGCDEYISQVVLGDINNSSSCDSYGDYTDLSTILNMDETYEITVSNGNYYSSDDLGIWIDWNQDGDFEDTGENIVCSIDSGGEGTFSFTVPTTALPGDTRMRIRMKYYGSDCGDPCGATTYGEVEDYTVSVLGWLMVEAASGTLQAGESEEILVTLDASDLESGIYTANLNFSSNDPDNMNVVVPVTLAVGEDIPTVSAYAEPSEVCAGEETQLHAEALGGSGTYTYQWTSIPEGFTSDEANPFVSPEDTTTYIVEVFDGLFTVFDTTSVNVNVFPGMAATPAGEAEMCQDSPNSTYTTEGAENALSYSWSLAPAEAGEIAGEGVVGIVDWNLDFSGAATITVHGINDCGEGEVSEAFEVTIHATPEVTLAEFEKVNVNTPPFELTGGAPEGGTYSGPGVSGGMFDPEAAGEGLHTITYTYEDEFGCTNFAEATILVEEASGINEFVNGFHLELFPNPSQGTFTLNLTSPSATRAVLRILNNQGVEIYSEEISLVNGYSNEFDLSGYAEGLYFVNIHSDESSVLKKIVIQK